MSKHKKANTQDNAEKSKRDKIKNFLSKHEPIKAFSKWLYDICGDYQLPVLIIVIIIVVVSVAFVILKNFFWTPNVVLNVLGIEMIIGKIQNNFLTSLTSTFLEIATLPILIITLMFSAHGSYKSDKDGVKMSEEIDDIKTVIDDFTSKYKDDIHKMIREEIKENFKREESEPMTETDSLNENSINDDKSGDVIPEK